MILILIIIIIIVIIIKIIIIVARWLCLKVIIIIIAIIIYIYIIDGYYVKVLVKKGVLHEAVVCASCTYLFCRYPRSSLTHFPQGGCLGRNW